MAGANQNCHHFRRCVGNPNTVLKAVCSFCDRIGQDSWLHLQLCWSRELKRSGFCTSRQFRKRAIWFRQEIVFSRSLLTTPAVSRTYRHIECIILFTMKSSRVLTFAGKAPDFSFRGFACARAGRSRRCVLITSMSSVFFLPSRRLIFQIQKRSFSRPTLVGPRFLSLVLTCGLKSVHVLWTFFLFSQVFRPRLPFFII